MDFSKFKKGTLKLKDKLVKQINKWAKFSSEKFEEAVSYSANKLKEKSIKGKRELTNFIKESKETSFTNRETWETKHFKHKVVVIFWDEKSDFFRDFLLKLPLLNTKAFASGTKFRLAVSNIRWVDLKKDYKISELPSMLVFQDEKVYKLISGKKNIEKIVKSFKMNVEEDLENF